MEEKQSDQSWQPVVAPNAKVLYLGPRHRGVSRGPDLMCITLFNGNVCKSQFYCVEFLKKSLLRCEKLQRKPSWWYKKRLDEKVAFLGKKNCVPSRKSLVQQLLYEPDLSQRGAIVCVFVSLQRGLLIRYSSRKCPAVLAVLSRWDLEPHGGSVSGEEALQAQQV